MRSELQVEKVSTLHKSRAIKYCNIFFSDRQTFIVSALIFLCGRHKIRSLIYLQHNLTTLRQLNSVSHGYMLDLVAHFSNALRFLHASMKPHACPEFQPLAAGASVNNAVIFISVGSVTVRNDCLSVLLLGCER